MWVYDQAAPGNISEREIINRYLKADMPEDHENQSDFTNESIYYLREILRPLIARLNLLKSSDDFNRFKQTIPFDDNNPIFQRWNLTEEGEYGRNFRSHALKKSLLDQIVSLITNDRETNESGVQIYAQGTSIRPWDIYQYLTERPVLNDFFHPSPVMVDVNNQTKLPLTYDQVLGIMAVYRHLHKPHPLTMYGFHFETEVDDTNIKALDGGVNLTDWYSVTVGTDTYSFDNIEFFQGLITGAQWNNLDPHSFITDLKQWKEELIQSNDVWGPTRMYSISLQY